jgi:GT2 family glycosyltransferase
VVLNAAEEGLADVAAGHARVVGSEVPLGFAGGANLGATHSRGELIHLLHDDAEPEPGWLAGLVAGLADEPRAGLAGSLLLDPDGAVQSAGGVLWSDATTSPWPQVPVRTTVVDYCSSASVLVRRDAWAAIGGLDEELYPAQYVDVDLALSLRSRGHLSVCAPGSVVRHARGGSSTSRQKLFAYLRNQQRLLARWSDEVAAQAPRGEGDEAFERAARSTAAQAARVRAMTPVVAELPPPAPPDLAGARRRDAAFQRAYAAWLEEQLQRADEIEARAVQLHAEVNRLHEAYRAEREARLAAEARAGGLP